jgi:hypothetical protein
MSDDDSRRLADAVNAVFSRVMVTAPEHRFEVAGPFAFPRSGDVELVLVDVANALGEAPMGAPVTARATSRGPTGNSARTNGHGAWVLTTSEWVGAVPGDAGETTHHLVLEDGAIVRTEVIDSCTMPSVTFAVHSGSKWRVDDLERAVRAACEQLRRVD